MLLQLKIKYSHLEILVTIMSHRNVKVNVVNVYIGYIVSFWGLFVTFYVGYYRKNSNQRRS